MVIIAFSSSTTFPGCPDRPYTLRLPLSTVRNNFADETYKGGASEERACGRSMQGKRKLSIDPRARNPIKNKILEMSKKMFTITNDLFLRLKLF